MARVTMTYPICPVFTKPRVELDNWVTCFFHTFISSSHPPPFDGVANHNGFHSRCIIVMCTLFINRIRLEQRFYAIAFIISQNMSPTPFVYNQHLVLTLWTGGEIEITFPYIRTFTLRKFEYVWLWYTLIHRNIVTRDKVDNVAAFLTLREIKRESGTKISWIMNVCARCYSCHFIFLRFNERKKHLKFRHISVSFAYL